MLSSEKKMREQLDRIAPHLRPANDNRRLHASWFLLTAIVILYAFAPWRAAQQHHYHGDTVIYAAPSDEGARASCGIGPGLPL